MLSNFEIPLKALSRLVCEYVMWWRKWMNLFTNFPHIFQGAKFGTDKHWWRVDASNSYQKSEISIHSVWWNVCDDDGGRRRHCSENKRLLLNVWQRDGKLNFSSSHISSEALHRYSSHCVCSYSRITYRKTENYEISSLSLASCLEFFSHDRALMLLLCVVCEKRKTRRRRETADIVRQSGHSFLNEHESWGQRHGRRARVEINLAVLVSIWARTRLDVRGVKAKKLWQVCFCLLLWIDCGKEVSCLQDSVYIFHVM